MGTLTAMDVCYMLVENRLKYNLSGCNKIKKLHARYGRGYSLVTELKGSERIRALDARGQHHGQFHGGSGNWPTCGPAEGPHFQVPRIMNSNLPSLHRMGA